MNWKIMDAESSYIIEFMVHAPLSSIASAFLKHAPNYKPSRSLGIFIINADGFLEVESRMIGHCLRP